jgi:aspartate aminotransferase
MVIRASYSTPPFGGARIADKILNNDQLFDQWKSELKEIANRVITVRSLLRNKLE